MTDRLTATHTYSADLSNFSTNRELPRHRWFEFKEGYSAELVKLACGESGKKRLSIIDPFMGSGTALVSAGVLRHGALGIEVNPFLHFAARAKCSSRLQRKVKGVGIVERLIRAGPREISSPLEGLSTFTESPELEKWIFNRSVLRGFTYLQRELHEAGCLSRPLRLALLSALMDCSNVRRDGKCVRYLKDWRKRGFTSASIWGVFKKRAFDVLEDLRSSAFECRNLTFRHGDCRLVLKGLEPKTFDLFVTSPPYLNSFDYSDVYRPELFAGGFVLDNSELRKVRLETIRSHVQVKRPYSDAIESPLLLPVLNRITGKLWSKDIPGMIRSYFSDMTLVLRELRRVVKSGGQGWLVVSTSAYAGVEVPVDLILADLATNEGWKLTGIYVLRQLRASGQHWAHLPDGAKPALRESLIVMKRA